MHSEKWHGKWQHSWHQLMSSLPSNLYQILKTLHFWHCQSSFILSFHAVYITQFGRSGSMPWAKRLHVHSSPHFHGDVLRLLYVHKHACWYLFLYMENSTPLHWSFCFLLCSAQHESYIAPISGMDSLYYTSYGNVNFTVQYCTTSMTDFNSGTVLVM